ncbi:MAG TPA: transcription termination/antitermination NusG family protein [Mycoplasmatales bacterium]|nr:transcription termination/antitermination NusG family protein [Mycoplasmatales bacterium]
MLNSKWYILLVKRNSEQAIIENIKNNLLLEEFSHIRSRIENIEFLSYKNENSIVKNAMPGYMFVNCYIDIDVLNFLKSVKGVLDFLSNNRNPDEIVNKFASFEISNFSQLKKRLNINRINKKKFKKSLFKVDDIIIVKTGLFKGFKGSVSQINNDYLTLKVEFLGRITPINIKAFYCEKI